MNMNRRVHLALSLLAILLAIFAPAMCCIACSGTNNPTDAESSTTSDSISADTQQKTEEKQTMTEYETNVPTESGTRTEPVEDPALNVFPTEGKNITIGIFWEPPYEYTNDEQYDWIRDANITLIEITNRDGAISKEASDLQLKLATERGLKVAYSVGVDGKSLLSMSETEIMEYVTSLAKNPTITDIHVIDEPAQPWIYATACAAISKAGINPRLNFLPYYATWVFDNYNGHLEDTIIATGKENYGTLCYDQYPFTYDGGVADMFYNLDIFRQIGLKYGVDTAFYIQSIGEGGNFRRTNGNEIRYHTSAGLAYGLKSMTYFTWWTTGFCDPKDYAIISPYGEKTDIYDDVASINAQILKVGPVLARLDAQEVYHTSGTEASITTCKKNDVPLYTRTGINNGVIISLMEDRETGRDYIMLVNKNYSKSITHEFALTDAITHLYELNSGEYVELDISSGKVELTFEPGGFILLAVGQQDNIIAHTPNKSANLAEGKAPAVDTVNPGNGWYAYCLTDGIRDDSVSNALGFRSANATGYVEVDLGKVTQINRVDVYPAGTKYTRGNTFPLNFKIEVSTDGTHWVTVINKTNYTDCLVAVPVFTFESCEAQYVRMSVTASRDCGYYEITEIEIYYDDGSIPTPDNHALYSNAGKEPSGTNIALERSVTASSLVPGWDPAALTDGNYGSGWTSGLNRHSTSDGEEWVLIDLAYVYEIDRVSLIGRPGDDYFPYKFRIEVSKDGTNFTTVYNGECPEQRAGQEPYDCTLDHVTGRYIRIVAYSLRDVKGFNDGHLLSLMEIEVYKK